MAEIICVVTNRVIRVNLRYLNKNRLQRIQQIF